MTLHSFVRAALVAALVLPAQAQISPSNCLAGAATNTLDVNNVSALLRTNGSMFRSPGASEGYEVPQGSGTGSVFQAGVWLGGLAGGNEFRMAGSTYGPYDFWPGPIDDDGRPPADCEPFDRIYKVSLDDIDAFEAGGTPATDLAEWPASLGAPVLDGDGDLSNYDLEAGDRPDLQGGDQTLWWVMNDKGNVPQWLGGGAATVGVEVQMQAWAVRDPSRSFLDNTTFYRARIHYRDAATLEGTYLGLWMDADVGSSGDDYIGSDPALDLAYAYNGDAVDEGGYGDRPAAIGVTMLSGLEGAERADLGATAAVYYTGSGTAQGRPESIFEAYNYMRAVWRDESPFTFGGDAYGGTAESHFVYTGTPGGAGWSESSTPGDRLFLLSTGPTTLTTGDVQEVEFAVVWAQADSPGSAAHFEAAAALKNEVAQLRAFATPTEPDIGLGVALSVSVWPNPVQGAATVSVALGEPQHARVEVLDALGRRVALVHEGPLAAGPHTLEVGIAQLPAGVYLVRAAVDGRSVTRTITLVR